MIFISSSSSPGYDYPILWIDIEGAFTITGPQSGLVDFDLFRALPTGLLIDRFKVRETGGHLFVDLVRYVRWDCSGVGGG